MNAMASQITSLTIVYSTIYSCEDQRKYQSSGSLAFVRGISPVTGEFPAQRASNTEDVSIWWRHHVTKPLVPFVKFFGISFFQNYRDKAEHRVHIYAWLCDISVLTPAKYECDPSHLSYTFAPSQLSQIKQIICVFQFGLMFRYREFARYRIRSSKRITHINLTTNSEIYI